MWLFQSWYLGAGNTDMAVVVTGCVGGVATVMVAVVLVVKWHQSLYVSVMNCAFGVAAMLFSVLVRHRRANSVDAVSPDACPLPFPA